MRYDNRGLLQPTPYLLVRCECDRGRMPDVIGRGPRLYHHPLFTVRSSPAIERPDETIHSGIMRSDGPEDHSNRPTTFDPG
jgi:hypothetical protein